MPYQHPQWKDAALKLNYDSSDSAQQATSGLDLLILFKTIKIVLKAAGR